MVKNIMVMSGYLRHSIHGSAHHQPHIEVMPAVRDAILRRFQVGLKLLNRGFITSYLDRVGRLMVQVVSL